MTHQESIASLLKAAGKRLTQSSDSPRLDAELLLAHCLQQTRGYLFTWPENVPTKLERSEYQQLIDRRLSGEPLAYLIGVREFWSEDFIVTPDTLIPRPETELLVELSLLKLKGSNGPFLDLGTGSGVIAISVAKERPDIEVVATDNSQSALDVARLNAKGLNTRVNFIKSNWLDETSLLANSQTFLRAFGVIASNPPYIAADDPHLLKGGLPHEPIQALRSCDNGFSDIAAIITTSPAYLKTGGWLLLEHGHTQGQRTADTMLENNFSKVQTMKDLSDNDRVTLGQRI